MFVEVERIVNEKRRKEGSQAANGMYILTGSQKYSLMKEVSESMSGRVSVIEMPTLSQNEIKNREQTPFVINNENLFQKCGSRTLDDDELYISIVRGFYPARWEIE